MPTKPNNIRPHWMGEKKPFERMGMDAKRIYNEVYNTPRWRALRDVVRREEPICRLCGKGATHTIDHILPIKQGGSAWDRSNLQGLCWHCNKIKTGKQAQSKNKDGAGGGV